MSLSHSEKSQIIYWIPSSHLPWAHPKGNHFYRRKASPLIVPCTSQTLLFSYIKKKSFCVSILWLSGLSLYPTALFFNSINNITLGLPYVTGHNMSTLTGHAYAKNSATLHCRKMYSSLNVNWLSGMFLWWVRHIQISIGPQVQILKVHSHRIKLWKRQFCLH